MKKVLLLFTLCLLLSGCSTVVTIKIDKDKVTETIKISGLKEEVLFNNQLNENIKNRLNVFEREYEYYDMKEFEDNDYVGKTYELSENIELWNELSHVRPCYETFKFEKTDGNITLNTSDEYRCGYLFGANNVTLIIESDLDLVSSNADEVQGNKLIWNINESNYQNKSISFNYKIEEAKSLQNYSIYYILFIVISLVIGGYVFIKKKNKENNTI